MAKWRCTICNYIHEGESPPEKCPVCGAGPDKFVPEPPAEKAVAAATGSGEPATLEEVRDRAREMLKGRCAVYPRCDGDRDNRIQRDIWHNREPDGCLGKLAANRRTVAQMEIPGWVLLVRYHGPDAR